MPEELLTQLVLQAPAIAVLVYLLFRLDSRLDQLIKVIISLATADSEADMRRAIIRLREQ